MSTTLSLSLSDFIAGVEKLDSKGTNWLLFEQQFTIAVKQKDAWGHFDGTSIRPVPAVPDTPTPSETTAIEAWDRKENLALYLLTLKVAPATYAKHKCKGTVAKVWAAIVAEYSSKSLLARSNMRRDFLNMRYEPGQDLRSELDRLQMAYENLLTYDVNISDTEYASVIINFLPDSLSAFISQLSAQMKLQARLATANTTTPTPEAVSTAERPVIEPDLMFELVIEEWEHRRDEKKVRASRTKDSGVAASAVSSEKPKWKGRGKGPQKPVRVCWNCGGKGHREAECPSPKSDSSKGKGNQKLSNNAPQHPKPAAGAGNIAIASARIEELADDDDYAGAWSAVAPGTIAALCALDADCDTCDIVADASPPVPDAHEAGPLAAAVHAPLAAVASAGRALDLYDSGATHHMSPYRQDFTSFNATPDKPLNAANQQQFQAKGVGEMLIPVPNPPSPPTRIKLTGVLYTPALGFNLISVGRIDDAGYAVTFAGGECVISDTKGKTVGRIPKKKGLYAVAREHESNSWDAVAGTACALESNSANAASDALEEVSESDAHSHFGHIAICVIRELVSNGYIKGIKLVKSGDAVPCKACVRAKLTCKPVPSERQGDRATEIGAEVHSDVWGPARITTLGGRKYYVSFTDDKTRFTVLYLMRQKSEVFELFKAFEAWLESHYGVHVKYLNTDRGGKYLSDDFKAHLQLSGIEYKLSVHDTSEEAGISERLNRMLMEKVRAMLIEAGLPRSLWGEAVLHATWLKNRTSTKALGGRTPFEAATGSPPNLRGVPVWGSKVWVHSTSDGKLGERAKCGRWLDDDAELEGVEEQAEKPAADEQNKLETSPELLFDNDVPEVDAPPLPPAPVDPLLPVAAPPAAPPAEEAPPEPSRRSSRHRVQAAPPAAPLPTIAERREADEEHQ
ncbi:hypothetical protein BN946_scf184638.g3 [Trametes cinnabarina]|uniref:Integrase catalytic domain-containing protein n=1 Tax=Pycnoporus cinnabarinus TaxID=5643 RepID=A0A060SU83_PYCCI|nr:hypothetical protein BN946_scf184638.g3 [Trametes cinnabarina]